MTLQDFITEYRRLAKSNGAATGMLRSDQEALAALLDALSGPPTEPVKANAFNVGDPCPGCGTKTNRHLYAIDAPAECNNEKSKCLICDIRLSDGYVRYWGSEMFLEFGKTSMPAKPADPPQPATGELPKCLCGYHPAYRQDRNSCYCSYAGCFMAGRTFMLADWRTLMDERESDEAVQLATSIVLSDGRLINFGPSATNKAKAILARRSNVK